MRAYHKFSHKKKSAFLAAFRENGVIRYGAEQAGIDRRTVYYWLEQDDAFGAAFELAKIDAKEAMETEARRRAMEGVRREKPIYYEGQLLTTVIETDFSDNLLMFTLKRLDPAYREKTDINVSGSVSVGGSDVPAEIVAFTTRFLEAGPGGDPPGVP